MSSSQAELPQIQAAYSWPIVRNDGPAIISFRLTSGGGVNVPDLQAWMVIGG